MIKLVYSHPHPLRIFLNNCLRVYRSSHFYSAFKESAGVLKHSRFSEFMGLAAQWRKLQREEEKNQKQQVRSSMAMIAICLVGFSIGAIFLQNDAPIMLKCSVLSKQMQLSFNKDKQKREAINKETIAQVWTFLEVYPYDYLSIISMLNSYVKQSINHADNFIVVEQLLNIYEHILKRNHSAKTNLPFLEGVSSLIEACYLQNKVISHLKLRWALLQGGTTKQIYMALKSMNSDQSISGQQRQSIIANLQIQMKKDAQYFQTVFEKIDEQQIPQISFKKRQTAQWSAYIQQRLNFTP